MRITLTILVLLCILSGCNQPDSYEDELYSYREEYKRGFLNDEQSPLTADDTSYLNFYAPDESYKVTAKVDLTSDAEPFEIPTVSGATKKYREFCILHFKINDTAAQLHVYQSLKLLNDPHYKNHLFVPFTDATTYTETYGGGRYIDLSLDDIRDKEVILDFNKCYNPWCAYADGYSCPIPPKENRLDVAIKAGEKMFGKEVAH